MNSIKTRTRLFHRIVCLLPVVALASCGSRPNYYNQPLNVTAGDVAILQGGFLIADEGANRIVGLTINGDNTVTRSYFPLGSSLATMISLNVPASDGSGNTTPATLVLTQGVAQTATSKGESPALTVFSSDTTHRQFVRHSPMLLATAKDTVYSDPQSSWAVLGNRSTNSQFVTNPNELYFVDLNQALISASYTPTFYTMHGRGTPQSMVFTPPLNLGPSTNALVDVLTDEEVILVDLAHVSDPSWGEIEVPLTTSSSTALRQPAAIDVDATAGAGEFGTLIRAVNFPNIFFVSLDTAPPPSPLNINWSATIKEVQLDGVPSDAKWVHTGTGARRAAALIPSMNEAVVIDPDTGEVIVATTTSQFTNMSIVTTDTNAASGSPDVALLWGGGNMIALWYLGDMENAAFRSVQATPLTASQVTGVMNPGAPYNNDRIVTTSSPSNIFVVDLTQSLNPTPLDVASGSFALQMASDGKSFWVMPTTTFSQFGNVSLANFHPTTYSVAPAIDRLANITTFDNTYAVAGVSYANGLGLSVFSYNSDGTLNTDSANYYNWLLLENQP